MASASVQSSITTVLHESLRGVDEAILEYISGVVADLDYKEASSPQQLAEIIGPLIEDASRSEKDIQSLCSKLASIIVKSKNPYAPILQQQQQQQQQQQAHGRNGGGNSNGSSNGEKRNAGSNANGTADDDDDEDYFDDEDDDDDDDDDDADVLASFGVLSAPVRLGDLMAQSDMHTASLQQVLMEKKKVETTTVNQKKLEKVEARLKMKQEKRALKELAALTHSSTVAANAEKEGAMTNFASNKAAASVVSKDIHIMNFDVSFAGKPLLQQSNLLLSYGRRYGLCGRNGIGKTTLLRALAKKEFGLPASLTIVHVEQEVIGDDTNAIDSVLQADTLRTSLLEREKELTSGTGDKKKESSEELSMIYNKLNEIEADKAPAKVAEILAGLSFSPEMQRMTTKEFSGGWRMRLSLARALFLRPELLLLDEPTNMLDVNAVLWLENYLQEWPHTIMCVSHDRDFLNAICTDVIHMHHLHLDHYKGDYDAFERARAEKLQNQQKEYEAQVLYRQHLQDFIDRWRYNANRAAQAQSKIKILEKLPDLQPVEMDAEVQFKFTDPEILTGSVIHFNDVAFSYSPNQPIFDKLNFGFRNDSRVAVVGVNGAGKSTFLKLITGDIRPVKGEAHRHRLLKIGYFSQHHVDQLELNMSAVEFLRSKFYGHPLEEYRRVLGSYGLSGDVALQPIRTLSGGQKSRVAFALIGMQRPQFLILDEPTNHLDIETVAALGNAINSFGGGVVLVSHDERLIKSTCTEIWVCENRGVTRFEGTFGDYKAKIAAEMKKKK